MTDDLLGLAAKRVAYLDQSQRLYAQNIANLDTPGFTPKAAIPFSALLNGEGTLPLAVTHTDDQTSSPPGGTIAVPARIAARAPDGNAVSLNQQLAEIARTQISQQYAVNIYKSYLGMFHTALGNTP
ncbi:MAG TPA: flagellar basal body protein [Acidiphilium sp.]